MSDVLAAFGVDGDALPDHTGHKNLPSVVPGRVAHIDADFTAYMIAADTVDELAGRRPMRDFRYKTEQVEDIARSIARQAGAEKYVMHLTPSGSNKGGRAEQAVQHEYQASRKNREDQPEHLHALRGYMGTEMPAIVHLDQEADDGLAQANWADPKNSVICSKDKDLLMVPGLHMDMGTLELWELPFDSYGHLEVKVSSSGKEDGIKGKGPAFFFAQCLMGDTADTIKGLPSVHPEFWVAANPTKAYTEALESGSEAKINKAIAALKHKPCGPKMAYNLLKDVTSVAEAFNLVRDMWLAVDAPFTHWKTGKRVSATQALLGDMRLLWMRRNKNPDDVLAFLKENI